MVSRDQLDNSYIDRLITERVGEGRSLDYKESVSFQTDEERADFLADVCALANSGGGDLVFGVIEERDENGQSTGIPRQATGIAGNSDIEVRRLEELVRTGIAPRVPIQASIVSGYSSGDIIVLRVLRSTSGPHMISYRNRTRFYGRTLRQNFIMDVDQIRSAFLRGADLQITIERFRNDRLAAIVSRETPIELDGTSGVIVHLLPTNAFMDRETVDFHRLVGFYFPPIGMTGFNVGHDFEGYYNYADDVAYALVFHNGVIEGVGVRPGIGSDQIALSLIETSVAQFTWHGFRAMEHLGIEGTVNVAVSVFGVRGKQLFIANGFHEHGVHTIRHDLLTPPAVTFDEWPNDDRDVAKRLRPAYDAIARAGGLSQSPNFGADGMPKW